MDTRTTPTTEPASFRGVDGGYKLVRNVVEYGTAPHRARYH